MTGFLNGLQWIEKAVAALAYVLVTGLLLAGILARELFSTSIWGSEKMAVFAAVYAAFLGMTLATAANGHLRPRFTDHWWPQAWQASVARAGDILSAALFIGTGIIAASYVTDTYLNHDRAMVLYWPLWMIQIIIPYAFLSCGVRHVAFAVRPDLKPRPFNPEA